MGGLSPLLGLEPVSFREKVHRLTGYTLFEDTSFESSAKHICEPQLDSSRLRQYVEKLKLGGTTDMAAGIDLANEKLRQWAGSRAMVVVTDGLPNDCEAALSSAQRAKSSGVDIITIGTDDADRDLLSRLATKTELSVMVSRHNLGRGIASTAKMLPPADRQHRLQS